MVKVLFQCKTCCCKVGEVYLLPDKISVICIECKTVNDGPEDLSPTSTDREIMMGLVSNNNNLVYSIEIDNSLTVGDMVNIKFHGNDQIKSIFPV